MMVELDYEDSNSRKTKKIFFCQIVELTPSNVLSCDVQQRLQT